MNNKGISTIMIILAALLFTAAVGTVYFYGRTSKPNEQLTQKIDSTLTPMPISSPIASASSDQTNINRDAMYKTYKNETYKYSIKYPSSWIITDRTGQTPNTPDLDYQLLNGSDWQCVTKECIEVTLKQNINIEQMKTSSGDAGMASNAEASAKEINGKEYTMVIRSFSSINNQTGKWKEDPEKSYFVYIPHKGNYLQIRGNLKMKETIDKIASSYYEYP